MLCNIPDADSLAHGEGTVRIGQNGFQGFICLVAVDNMNIICPFDNGIEIGRFMLNDGCDRGIGFNSSGSDPDLIIQHIEAPIARIAMMIYENGSSLNVGMLTSVFFIIAQR